MAILFSFDFFSVCVCVDGRGRRSAGWGRRVPGSWPSTPLFPREIGQDDRICLMRSGLDIVCLTSRAAFVALFEPVELISKEHLPCTRRRGLLIINATPLAQIYGEARTIDQNHWCPLPAIVPLPERPDESLAAPRSVRVDTYIAAPAGKDTEPFVTSNSGSDIKTSIPEKGVDGGSRHVASLWCNGKRNTTEREFQSLEAENSRRRMSGEQCDLVGHIAPVMGFTINPKQSKWFLPRLSPFPILTKSPKAENTCRPRDPRNAERKRSPRTPSHARLSEPPTRSGTLVITGHIRGRLRTAPPVFRPTSPVLVTAPSSPPHAHNHSPTEPPATPQQQHHHQ
ncbi:hypothetical protein NL676_012698 [Syzygium grande]|nr:hypothetical protein NL676_012698 [Syzygium grande]